eukprot:255961_1
MAWGKYCRSNHQTVWMTKLKEFANNMVASQNYSAALIVYAAAFKLGSIMPPKEYAMPISDLGTIKAKIANNVSCVYLKLGIFDKAQQWNEKALQLNGKYKKCLDRRKWLQKEQSL